MSLTTRAGRPHLHGERGGEAAVLVLKGQEAVPQLGGALRRRRRQRPLEQRPRVVHVADACTRGLVACSQAWH